MEDCSLTLRLLNMTNTCAPGKSFSGYSSHDADVMRQRP